MTLLLYIKMENTLSDDNSLRFVHNNNSFKTKKKTNKK